VTIFASPLGRRTLFAANGKGAKSNLILKGTKYILLKNGKNLSQKQFGKVQTIRI
jgi:hypothetical protein